MLTNSDITPITPHPRGRSFSALQRPLRLLAKSAALLIAAGLFSSTLNAATFTWDASGANAVSPTDGAGTWSTTGTNWSNGASDAAWINAANNAVFGNSNGAAGTVTVSGSISVGGITFNPASSGAYTIQSGTIGLSNATITTNAGLATIGSVLTGTSGLITTGTGTLKLTGVNTYTGTTSVNAGTLLLDLSGQSGLGVNLPSALVVGSAGTLTINSNSTFSIESEGSTNISLSGSGVFNKTGAGDFEFFGGSIKNFAGQINVVQGILGTNGSDWGSSAGLMNVNISSGAYLDIRTGSIVINQLAGAGTLGSSYQNGSALSVGNNNGSSIFSGNIVNNLSIANATAGGALTLTKNGSGTLTLTNTNTYSGATTINGGGTLEIGNFAADASSAMTINAGTLQFDNAGKTVSALTVSSTTTGAALVLTASSGATTTVTGAFNHAGNYTVDPVFASVPTASSTFNLLTAGSITGSGTGSVNLSYYGPTRVTGSLALTGSQVQFVVTNGAANLVWNNAANTGVWDLNTTSNFSNSGTNSTFESFDAVTFNDTVPAGTITLSGSLAPSSVTVSSTGSYTFAGSGSIVGAGSLTKTGTGTLLITNTNSYTGATTISGGILQLGNGTQNGVIISNSIVDNGGLVINNPSALALQGAISGTGAVTQAGPGALTISGAGVTYTGATTVNSGTMTLLATTAFNSAATINPGATLAINNNGSNQTLSAPAMSLNGGTLAYVAPGNAYLVLGGAVNTSGSSNILISPAATASALGLFLDGGLKGSGTVTVSTSIADSGLDLRNNNTTFSGTLIVNGIASTTAGVGSGLGVGGCTTGLTNADIVDNGTIELLNQGIGWADSASGAFAMGALSGSGVMVGNFTSGGITTVTLGGSGHTGNFSGTIANGAGNTVILVKTGTGTQVFSGANTYTGATTDNGGGTLKLDFSAATSPTSNIISSSSALTLGGLGTTLAIVGSGTAANSQTFNGTTLTGSSALEVALTTNATPQNLVLNLGAITRGIGAVIDFTEPSGVLSSSNGILTSSGTGGGLLNIGGADYATVNGGSDWAAKDSSNTFIVPLSSIANAYTASSSTTLSGSNADIGNGVTTTTLAGNDTLTSLRFNQPQATTINIGSADTLVTGGILVTGSVGNNLSSITSGTLEGPAGGELAIFQDNPSNSLLISATIANNTSATALTKAGPGTLTLTASNTYTGPTYVDAGTLQLGDGATTLGYTGTGNIIDNATLAVPNFTAQTINNIITGSGLLIKTGTGTLTLGGANTLAGSILVRSGTLKLGVSGALGTSTLILGQSGDVNPTIDFGGFSPAISALTVGANVTGAKYFANTSWGPPDITGTTTLNSPLTVQGGGAGAAGFEGIETDGPITGNGGGSGNDTLIFNPTGSPVPFYWQLGGSASNFLGNIHFEGGQTGIQGFISGSNQFPSTAMIIIDSGATVNFNNFNYTLNETIDGLSGGGTLTRNIATFNLTLNTSNPSNNGNRIFSGNLAGLNTFTKTGTGTQVFSGADTYTCATIINQGTLQLGNGGTTGSLSLSSSIGGLTGGTLAFNRTNAVTQGTDFTSTAIGGGIALAQDGTGKLTLSSANTYTGGTIINSGTININADAALGGTTGAVTFTGPGTLQAGAAGISLSSARGIGINSGVTAALDTNGNNMTVNGAITGSGSLNKIGSGKLTLAGNESYGGTTTVSAGTLFIGGTFGSSPITVNNGANLDGTGLITSSVTISGGGLLNMVDNSINTLTLGNGLSIGSNSTASIMDFEGSGSSFDLLNISSGSLALSGSVTVNISAIAGLNAGTYNLITYSGTSGSGVLTLGSTFVSGKNLSLLNTGTSEELIIAGAAAYWKGGNSTSWSAAGPTNWTADPAGTTGTTAPTSAVDVFFNANGVGGPLTTSLGANFDVNSLNFNSNTTGSTTISDGTFGLTLEGGGITVSASAAPVTVNVKSLAADGSQTWANNSGNLFTVSSPVSSAVASGTTTLTTAGSGTGNVLLAGPITDGTAGGKLALMVNNGNAKTILDGSNGYTGGTTITSGTLQVGNNDAAGTLASGPVTNNSALVFNRTDTATVANAIGGSGNLIQAGSGTTILTASNNFTGTTTINAGTLQLGDGVSNLGYIGSNSVTDNATLTIANYTAQTFGNGVNGSGSLVKSGAGTLTLGGSNSLGGGIVVRNGTLKLGASTALGTSALTLGLNGDNNPTLDFGGFSPVLTSLTVGSNVTNAKLIANTTFAPPAVSGTTTLNSPLTIAGGPNGVGGNEGFETDGPITGNGGGSGNDSLIFNMANANESFYWQMGGSSYNFLGNIHFENGTTNIQGFIPGSNQLPSTAMLIIDSNAFVNWNNFNYTVNQTIDGLSGGGSMTTHPGFVTLNLTLNTSNPSNNGNRIYSGSLSNLNSLIKTGTGTQVFSGANTYTGATNIYQGTLQIGTGGTTGSISSSSAISGSAGGTLAYDLSSSGTISNSINGGINVTQAGSGRLTLAGSALGYSGTTTVTNGTLIVAGSISGNAIVTGGTFGTTGGSDTIGQNLTVGNGLGAAASSVLDLSLGGGAGTTILNVTGNVSLNSDAAYVFALNSGALGHSDGLAVSGTLTLTGALLQGQDVGNTALTPGQDQILIASYGTLNGTFAGLPEGALINIGQNWFSIDYGNINADEITLTSAAIPEPGTWGTVLVGFAMLIGLQRRRRSKLP